MNCIDHPQNPLTHYPDLRRRLRVLPDVAQARLTLLDEDDQPHVVGVTRPIAVADGEPLRALLPLAGAPRGTRHSCWHGLELVDWLTLPPRLVCEVRFAYADGGRLRQAATFVRWRPDRDVADCRSSHAAVAVA